MDYLNVEQKELMTGLAKISVLGLRMWCFRIRFSGGQGSVVLTVGPDDLMSIFHP